MPYARIAVDRNTALLYIPLTVGVPRANIVVRKCFTTKSEGLVLLLCGYFSFISEMLAIVRDC